MNFVAVAVGGAIGSTLRYAVGLIMAHWGITDRAYLPTLIVNLTGSFILGFFVGFFTQSNKVSSELRAFLTTGLCGGFTTFSALSVEGWLLLEKGNTVEAITYLTGSILGGLVSVALGFKLGVALTKIDA